MASGVGYGKHCCWSVECGKKGLDGGLMEVDRDIQREGGYLKAKIKIEMEYRAERIKVVVGKLVGEVQNEFVKGRYILDGVLSANETVRYIKKARKKCLLFKVDFEKAYDSLNWDFLLEVLIIIGFESKWCKWVEACLASASISVLVNGSPTKEFNMGRGVRQGDPLSLFLFILAAKGLNLIMQDAVDKGLYRGVGVGNEAVSISHLQYADDIIYFANWSKHNAKNLMCILKGYEKVSGLKINFNKSKVYVIGISNSALAEMTRVMKCCMGELPLTYLGLPIGVSMRRESAWRPVIENFKKEVNRLEG
nr:cysteine-rich receptor-like protein kinase [Tanacetum cinerariifolium]